MLVTLGSFSTPFLVQQSDDDAFVMASSVDDIIALWNMPGDPDMNREVSIFVSSLT